MTKPLMTTSIIIIGAGPSGLAALKTLLSTEEVQQGLWTPRIFESSSDLGGVWHRDHDVHDQTPSSPIYNGLTTNLPHPIMGFGSFPFPASTPLFPSADIVQQYIQSYADHFELRRHITFSARVEHVLWDPPTQRWNVTIRHMQSDGADREEKHTCALLLVCNGHHNIARIPSLPGLSALLSSGHASHSQTYRNPASLSHILASLPMPLSLKSSTILIVGSGPSGQDISAILSSHTKRVFLSTSKTIRIAPTHPSIILKPRTSHFVDRTAFFEDGSSEDIDYVILATGYIISFPFFPSTSTSFTISSTIPIPTSLSPHPHPIHIPLTLTPRSSAVFPLARHLFGLPSCGFSPASSVPESLINTDCSTISLPPPTSLAFFALLVRVVPLPIAESQARAIIAAFRASHSNASRSSSASTPTPTNANDNDGKMHDSIDWAHEHDLIRARHALLCSSFPLAPSDTQQLENHLATNWDRFADPLAQFEYRDALDDLSFSLNASTQASTHDQASERVRVRVKSWERHFYTHKDALRQAWRLLEERGLADDWVRGVGSGDHDRPGSGSGEGRTPEDRTEGIEAEWVDFMYRVLEYWDAELKSSLRGGDRDGDGAEGVQST